MRWTTEQQTAIDTDTGHGNLLVSAAAGSGKTAVLVERVLQKILNNKSSVDRLLIVTFTEAAASEMREKIVRRLREYISDPTRDADTVKKIKEQIRLTETADIMTIDAFCNRVVQNNFHALGIDPDIRICDESMTALMKNEAMANLFRRLYKATDTQNRLRLDRLTSYYAKDRSNATLEAIILSVYEFCESFSEPMEWVKNAAESYKLPFEDWASIKYHIDISKSSAEECLKTMNMILAKDGIDKNLRTFAETVGNICRRIADATDWDSIYNVYNEYFSTKKKLAVFDKMASEIPLDEFSETAVHAFSSFTDMFCIHRTGEKITLGITKPFSVMKESYNADLLYEEATDIAWIVQEFDKDFTAVKENKGVYEFADIEHLTYSLFKNNEFVREAYKNKYDEILIDEYQDTNMLQDSIFELISHDNIFMVGDLKQSIYKFRNGDPYIFKEKSEEYSQSENAHDRIVLSQNFRSRQSILNSVNDIFSRIMSQSAGDVDYRDSELITRKESFEYYPETTMSEKSELYFLSIPRGTAIDTTQTEARFTAQKIYELLNSDATVFDKSLGVMRPIMKKDIVILRSSVKGIAKQLTDELSKLGIDSFVDKSSFFDRREISIMLSLLSVINNTHQDIPLIAVMRSPIGGFSDNDLAEIRLHSQTEKFFIDAVCAYAETGKITALKYRTQELIRSLRRWRGYIRKKSVAQLIWAIYEETCFYDIMGALDEGDEAQTNLRLLYERARTYENAGFKGLFNFIKYLERIQDETLTDMGGAKLISEGHDVVRIMTIHKSKGLEFPVVFLLGAGSDFRTTSDYPLLRLHKNLGFGLSHIYYDRHFSRDTFAKELIKKVNHTEALSERMRLLYVALTRAKEKLYVIAARKMKTDTTEETMREEWSDMLVGKKFTPATALCAKGFHSWLCPAALVSDKTWDLHYIDIDEEIEDISPDTVAPPITVPDSTVLEEAVYKILDYKYPFEASHTIPSRTSVTQLKEMENERDEESYEPENRRVSEGKYIVPLEKRPRFMTEDGKKRANEIGTLYHLIMSSLDLDNIRNGTTAEAELERLIAEEIISTDDMTYINGEKIEAFINSPLARRMLNAQRVYREAPFQINISAREYDPTLPKEYETETVILQGIIDCFFEEDGELVLFDYKTDKVKNSAELRKKYDKQLELYSKAIEKLTGKHVKEKYLYLFDTNEII